MNIIKELWHGNVYPQTDSRNNSLEMKELMEYMARHHDDLIKTMSTSRKSYSKSLMIAGASIQAYLKPLSLNMPSNLEFKLL